MSSGDYARILKRRALSFLAEAREARDPDLVVFFVEQAVQLYLKAVLFELFGERIRGHGIRELLGLLARRLEEAGYVREAESVRELVVTYRSTLVELEEAYTLARYGERGYTSDEASKILQVGEKIIKFLEEISRVAKLG